MFDPRIGRKIYIMGDMNTDIAKTNHNTFSLLRFLKKNNLTMLDVKQTQTTDFTYRKIINNKCITSWIDHVITDQSMDDEITCRILESDLNLGDHQAISTTLEEVEKIEEVKPEHLKIDRPKIKYQNHHQRRMYQQELEKLLHKEPFLLDELSSECPSLQRDKINEFLNKISSLMIKAVTKVKNVTKEDSKKKKKKIRQMKYKSWWDSRIQELHRYVIECYIEYKESDFKSEVAKTRLTDAKREFRKQKRHNLSIKRDRIARQLNDFFKLDKQGFWSRIKQMQRSNEKIDVPINDLRDHYQQIFTTRNKPETYSDMCNEKFVNDFVQKYKSVKFNHKIDIKRLISIINNLPNNKSIGLSDVTYEMLKYANNIKLYEAIKTTFEFIINNQMMPYLFNISVIKPLIKDTNKPNTDISNLRPVAISDCISNLFEAVILDMLDEEHTDHPKQFGFKKNSSCQHAVWVLKRAIEMCKKKGKRAYICAIDASKAFDKVNRTTLWRKLIEDGTSPHIVLSIINYYKDSLMLVKNGFEYSSLSKTTIGVRQGGKASPKLFSIYTEKILNQVSSSPFGIKFGSIKLDIIAYADDLLLITSTKRELQELLDIVASNGRELEIKFNPSKTVYLIMNRKLARKANEVKEDWWQNELTIDGDKINKVTSLKYLGYELDHDYNDMTHIEKRRKAAQGALAKTRNLEILSQDTSAYLKGHIYKTFIMPVLFYGMEIIDLTKTNMKIIKRFESNLIRTIYGIPKRCRTSNLRLAINIMDTIMKLKQIQIEFFERLIENSYTREILKELLKIPDDNDYISYITSILDEIEHESELSITEKCKYYKYVIRLEVETSKKNNSVLEEIRQVFGKFNGCSSKLYEILKYNREYTIRVELA